jgi:hypothetical protein
MIISPDKASWMEASAVEELWEEIAPVVEVAADVSGDKPAKPKSEATPLAPAKAVATQKPAPAKNGVSQKPAPTASAKTPPPSAPQQKAKEPKKTEEPETVEIEIGPEAVLKKSEKKTTPPPTKPKSKPTDDEIEPETDETETETDQYGDDDEEGSDETSYYTLPPLPEALKEGPKADPGGPDAPRNPLKRRLEILEEEVDLLRQELVALSNFLRAQFRISQMTGQALPPPSLPPPLPSGGGSAAGADGVPPSFPKIGRSRSHLRRTRRR